MAAATPVVKRVAIVGAGVGGLTLANALCKGEMAVEEVKVFEKFDSVKPGIGGGVQINSGAVTLARLGLGDAVKVCHIMISAVCVTLSLLAVREASRAIIAECDMALWWQAFCCCLYRQQPSGWYLGMAALLPLLPPPAGRTMGSPDDDDLDILRSPMVAKTASHMTKSYQFRRFSAGV